MLRSLFAGWVNPWTPPRRFWWAIAGLLALSGAVCLTIGATIGR